MKQAFALRAWAKINLGLKVVRRRSDGYHDLESVMQQVSIADTLLLEPSPGWGRHFFCTETELAGPDNLVCRAAEILESAVGGPLPGVKITLVKKIPVGAGLAGGSADAAAALRGLNHYWRLGLGLEELLNLGAKIGSDVPFCLTGGTVLVRGRGELLELLPELPFFWVVLALPRGIRVSTAEAYRSLGKGSLGEPDQQFLMERVLRGDRDGLLSWLARETTNTFDAAPFPGSGYIMDLKARLRRQGYHPALSGTGPALFMMFENYSRAHSAAKFIERGGEKPILCWTAGRDKRWKDV